MLKTKTTIEFSGGGGRPLICSLQGFRQKTNFKPN